MSPWLGLSDMFWEGLSESGAAHESVFSKAAFMRVMIGPGVVHIRCARLLWMGYGC